jgi:ribose 5-phosphate isomerase B
MKLAIATDHNGVNEKKEIISYLVNQGFDVVDLSQDNTPIDDYPDFAKRVCEEVLNKKADLGILMCGTGIGMSIAANKFKGIRCAKVSNESEAILAREHNNANVIALSYKDNINNLKLMIEKFVKTDFSNEERHIRRIEKIGMLEQ